jgi:hypothetical protein
MTTNLRQRPDWLSDAFDGEPVHGWWAATEQGPICHDGCFAPGSSPHSHGTIVGYWVITDRSRLYFSPDGICQRAGVLHR